jgi:hypothetical protein
MTELFTSSRRPFGSVQPDEAGVFVDYANKLAAALEALADQLTALLQFPKWKVLLSASDTSKILAIAAELRGTPS